MSKTNTTERLSNLRRLMHERSLAAFIIPTADAHQSEYVAESDKRRQFISGFTGSAGIAVVTSDTALLWTDGRYFLQAEGELDHNWVLMKSEQPGVLPPHTWLSRNVRGKVGVDPYTVSSMFLGHYRAAGVEITFVENLVDIVWGADRPARPCVPAMIMPANLHGNPATEKIRAVRQAMTANKCEVLVVAALDEVAWLLNIRGGDVMYNPVLMAYCIVTQDSTLLCANDAQLDAVRGQLHADGVKTVDYHRAVDVLREICGTLHSGARVWLDSRQCNLALVNAVGNLDIETSLSPIAMAKALKNAAELEGLRVAHVKDAVALVTFLSRLERQMLAGASFNECSAADMLDGLRAEQPGFVSLSFPTISASGANGAIIHYLPHRESCASLHVNELYLVDSGAQFIEGTTDVTRTVAFSNPSAWQRECYTRVLKGHVDMGMQVFPNTTCGYQLDVIARSALWQAGLDYRHGTGHGVGAFLNVHEGPHLLSFRMAPSSMVTIQAGMTTSNEPGYYEDGQFGIRIENVMAVVEAQPQKPFGSAKWLQFDTLTVVPYDARLIELSLLSEAEVAWIDAYHKRCYDTLHTMVDEETRSWLADRTRPLKEQCSP